MVRGGPARLVRDEPARACPAAEAQQAPEPELIGTVFHQPWWLQIAGGGRQAQVEVRRGERVLGRLPYVIRRGAFGLPAIGMPRLTHELGPALAPELCDGRSARTSRRALVIGQLLAQLPRVAHVGFRLHGGLTDCMAFEAAGFTCTAQFSVELDPAPREEAWARLRKKTRNIIRRAGEMLDVTESADVAAFCDFYEACQRAAGKQNAYREEPVAALLGEALRRGAGRLLFARRAGGPPLAALVTVWDARREYYYMCCRRPEAPAGAINLLVWHALQGAGAAGRIFDMDGIHVVGGGMPNLRLVTGFGGRVAPRFWVARSARLVTLARCLLPRREI